MAETAASARTKCGHCGGTIITEPDGKVLRLVCQSCGREPVESGKQLASNGVYAGNVKLEDLDWRLVAEARLKRLIVTNNGAEKAIVAAREEAERIVAALKVGGGEGWQAPELPWSKAGTVKRRAYYNKGQEISCVQCGVPKDPRAFRDREDGRKVCRKCTTSGA